MIREFNDSNTAGRFIMHVNNEFLHGLGMRDEVPQTINTFVYNKGEEQTVTIDEINYKMPSKSILPLVSNQHFSFEHPAALLAWQFNREFYCILDHDAEVGCVGFLFYGIHHPMFILLGEKEVRDMAQLEQTFGDEWQFKDKFQGEMLRTLLKRLIIKATRVAKEQCDDYRDLPDDKLDIVRKFSLILEGNFRKEHGVKFYADGLNKSPKTLTNLFALLNQQSPSKLIQNRIILEAKRYLHYTDKSAKEIAYELGFESPAHFSKFFKSYAGDNISSFRKK
ncbi:AraC family transcriptional regulator [Chitinophaga caeni]|uniref:AraC family transcriptional regulator n=1 Tax=Chitinophaga caeni TaxID=2029983 RepID=A0A291QWM3_9BACT|nr:helix-turn-helix domain-containing protein [Chitinophaga caeni]ATL48358.1 AraC family transcriptional regulator [Chitinophaga caeni]